MKNLILILLAIAALVLGNSAYQLLFAEKVLPELKSWK